jgi:hypothetical protein
VRLGAKAAEGDLFQEQVLVLKVHYVDYVFRVQTSVALVR